MPAADLEEGCCRRLDLGCHEARQGQRANEPPIFKSWLSIEKSIERSQHNFAGEVWGFPKTALTINTTKGTPYAPSEPPVTGAEKGLRSRIPNRDASFFRRIMFLNKGGFARLSKFCATLCELLWGRYSPLGSELYASQLPRGERFALQACQEVDAMLGPTSESSPETRIPRAVGHPYFGIHVTPPGGALDHHVQAYLRRASRLDPLHHE
ncbi:hypothetical protein BDV93DRAFT_47586 [Ceratobasidium sp. AG-I]|nr:hypothetical protein BDV93DRAFT_47586 [Ceratobasidium sp. AG-I]